MALLDQFNASKDADFKAKVTVAMLSAAVSITTEDPGTANHDARLALAKKVIRFPDQWINVFSLMVVTNVAINVNATDNDIEFTIASVWDSIAMSIPVNA